MPFGQKPFGQQTFDQHIDEFNVMIARLLLEWFYCFWLKSICPKDICLNHLWNQLYRSKAPLKKGPCLLVKNQLAKRHLANTSMTSILSFKSYSLNGYMLLGQKSFCWQTFDQHINELDVIIAKVLFKWFHAFWSKTIWVTEFGQHIYEINLIIQKLLFK